MQSLNDVLDVIVEPRYDSATIPTAGSTLLTLFAVPIGQGQTNWGGTGIAKNLADTNMDLAAQLPAGYNFVVLGFSLMPAFNQTQADATLAFNGCVFQFVIGSKVYLRIPAALMPAGNGPQGFFTQTAAATAAVIANGWPNLANIYSIARKPLTLAQTQNFQVTLTWPSGAQGVTSTLPGQSVVGLPLRVYLHGYLKRIVQ